MDEDIASALRGMSAREWPSDGLEPVSACPVCDSPRRTLLHEGLSDKIFFAAPGRWTLFSCARCGSAYLDPRPTEAMVGLAYEHYYTHGVVETLPVQSLFGRIRSRLGNGYRNHRYGTELRPSSALGAVLGRLSPRLAQSVDIIFRYIPKCRSGSNMRLLDFGCGNGSFLAVAKSARWNVAGVDPDPAARAAAAVQGIDVHPSLDDLAGQLFDYVTINHVIEHVHDPVQLLRNLFSLLRPGGGLFVETPNIDAIGHRIYGPNWRGLEPPRHLVLFNWASLEGAMRAAGFTVIERRYRTDLLPELSIASRRIMANLDPYQNVWPDDPAALSPAQLGAARRSLEGTEFLTMTAQRPR